MALKKIKLEVASQNKLVDPLEIFQKLKLKGPIQNIWEPQAEALRKWQKVRTESDIVIQMNTGGGKTLVGMLIAQSLTNETRGKVLYVCANNQLIEQTESSAQTVGLTPASRYKGNWSNQVAFDSGNSFCLTNYASLFNGRSIFRGLDITGIVFDDAHVAENLIRDQFTLRIPADNEVFTKILEICRRDYSQSCNKERLEDIAQGQYSPVSLIPTFIIKTHGAAIRKLLTDNGVDKNEPTKFAWMHLKDHLSHCCVFLNHNCIEITPAILPVLELAFFKEATRRIFLTATLPSQVSFVRTFGISKPTTIQPAGKSGDAQRLFVFLSGDNNEEQRQSAKGLVANRKSCVISPSQKKANGWVPPASIYDTNSGQQELDRFSKSTAHEMLAFVARYDGIDLPGDACRILIIDGLPSGENHFDRFMGESSRVESISTAHTATRLVQAIGRIFRSNTDHGVVVLVGLQLQSWLRSPKHLAYMPKLLQQQLLLSCELVQKVESKETTWAELIEAILNGEPNWDNLYDQYIEQVEANVLQDPFDWQINLALCEQDAYLKIWNGQYSQAAHAYSELGENTYDLDKRLAAWFYHWCGISLLLNNDKNEAMAAYTKAANSFRAWSAEWKISLPF